LVNGKNSFKDSGKFFINFKKINLKNFFLRRKNTQRLPRLVLHKVRTLGVFSARAKIILTVNFLIFLKLTKFQLKKIFSSFLRKRKDLNLIKKYTLF
jgi:hypothetical protein